ncbi:hypothetical protein [Paraburkholderia tropica]|uniref:hypothetical protein n=1 Tax=Paraburkholderia tropica TaxID=92647 RepID=UPI002ABDB190|nr:hypothetical protein [Paraburkholderia tropica]
MTQPESMERDLPVEVSQGEQKLTTTPRDGAALTNTMDAAYAPEKNFDEVDVSSTGSTINTDSVALELSRSCSRVRHATDAEFIGHTEIDRVASILTQPNSEDTVAQLERKAALEGASALIRLVSVGSTLTDAEVDCLDVLVQATFGRVVSIAATRGNLKLLETSVFEKSMNAELSDSDDALDGSVGLAKQSISQSATFTKNIDKIDFTHGAIVAPNEVQAELRSGPASEQSKAERYGKLEGLCAYRGGYDQRFWINSHGEVAPAPWMNATFGSLLLTAAKNAWHGHRPDLAYVYARALQEQNCNVPVSIIDLSAADALLDAPGSLVIGTDPTRVDRLREALNEPQEDTAFGLGLALSLEAVRPTLPTSLNLEEVESLGARAGYKDPAITAVIVWMLKAWQAGMNPLQQLRERVLAEPLEDAETLMELLAEAEERFRDTVATNWSTAGGRLQRTHCRRAWSEFIEKEVTGLRQDFGWLSTKSRLNPSGSQGQIRARLARMAKSYADAMDRAGVRFQDRSAADSAVAAIAEALLRIGDVLQRLSIRQQRVRIAFDACPVEEARRVLQESSSDATDQICALIFKSVLQEACELNVLRIPSSALTQMPDLVKYLPPTLLSKLDQSEDETRIAVTEISDSRAASALLLELATELEPGSPISTDVIRSVREAAVEWDRRDILSALSPTRMLETHERTLLNRGALDLVELLFRSLHELEALWSICEELMVDQTTVLQCVVAEARDLVEKSSEANTLLDGRLIEHWMRQTILLCESALRDALDARLALAQERSADTALQLKQLFEDGKYREAVALLHFQEPFESTYSNSRRLTVWRSDALSRFPHPSQALASDLRGDVDAQHALVDAWLEAPMSTERDALHRIFYAVASGEAYRPPTEIHRRGIVLLRELREFRDRKTLIDSATLREYFHAAGRNPSFLPQLAAISKIVIVSLPAVAGTNVLDEFARAIAIEAENALVVFLEPGLTKNRRDELTRGLRERALLGAIIDDVDLCRICLAVRDSEDPAFIAFLEIILEQQDLERFSPFSTQDGQHVRVETFVGRAREADELALSGKYSRVFSGRKLGKSALLKYVAKRYDRQSLPSGQRLHVLFIAIAGGDSEQYVVDCIIAQMSRRFEMPELEVEGSQEDRRQRTRLSSYMHQFLVSHPSDSVLLILDEADSFVEEQLANYDTARETSLSFCLLKELPADVDRNDLPRIRTIFSGYRVTNTRDGVWANAGDVLVLRPLLEDEAVGFITGALARIGVDIGDHGPYIARRCGRQPAVLIRFGEVLLKHLSRAGFVQGRETLRVSSAVVTAALTDQVVADEIRTVVANNFQGNRVGHAIFGATLLGLKDLAPGHALTDGPAQVLEKLKEIDSELTWLTRIDASPTAVIERNLQEFIDRELLTVSETQRFGTREYRLKFPHFLPVLTQADTSLDVRQRIRSLKDNTPSRLGRCAISESMLEKARYCYRESPSAECKLIVVTGHWLEALLDPKCGLVNRLGCTNRERAEALASREEDVPAMVAAGVRVFLNSPLTYWGALLSEPAPSPLVVVGGMAWLRKAIDYQMSGGTLPIQLISQGRLSDDTIRWWLEGARALHFESPAPVDKLIQMTEGIPLFAAAFNRALVGLPATAPAEDALMQAYESLAPDGMERIAHLLTDPESPDYLTRRERDLLTMAVKVSKELDGEEFDLEADFSEYWSYCSEGSKKFDPPMSLPEDRLALLVLIASGLVSIQDEGAALTGTRLGVACINPEGPVAKLVTVLERTREV